MAQISERVLKAVAQSSANEKDIISAIRAAGTKPAQPMETPSDAPRRKRTYNRRDMTAES